MQDEETMDLKHNNGVNGTDDDTYIPNSKSTDLIKSKSGNLDNQQPSGESFFVKIIK